MLTSSSTNPVEGTGLFQHLSSHARQGATAEHAKKLSGELPNLCKEAAEIMKRMPALHEQYTLHDDVHLLRVTDLAWVLMPEAVRSALNPIEVALLILACHFHDIGMVPSAERLAELKSGEDYQVFRSTWNADRPNVQELRRRADQRNVTREERIVCGHALAELERAALSDYLRGTHGDHSAREVRELYGTDKRLEVGGTSLTPLLARLCESHTLPATDLSPSKGFHYDESIGAAQANLVLLGLTLRLADLLDFDRERTPDTLYRSIDFKSGVSLLEWEKHRSVDGWRIEGDLIRFTARCERPEYEHAVRAYMDMIDRELADAHAVLDSFPKAYEPQKLRLPQKVDRSRIGPKDNAYIYGGDLGFSLSRDEIVRLLMTESLYKAPCLCVRELVQNSLDALGLRRAIIERDNGSRWAQGAVRLEHCLDREGRQVLRCTDNGAGMDEEIVRSYLLNVGKSYYRSPRFEQEKGTLSARGIGFQSCSQFGIGFMSCFMLGDQITVTTRRDRGPNAGHGDPLIVEINGVNNMVVLRSGDDTQPIGTCVEIVLRDPPEPILHELEDRVRLVPILGEYVRRNDFEVAGTCSIPGIEEDVTIAPGFHPGAGVRTDGQGEETLVAELSEIHPDLEGRVYARFLVDAAGSLVTANESAFWERRHDREPEIVSSDSDAAGGGDFAPIIRETNWVSVNGILVAGRAGGTRDEIRVGFWTNPHIPLGRMGYGFDVRGQLTPELLPDRTPQHRGFVPPPPGWQRLEDMVARGAGVVWEEVARRTTEADTPGVFWELAAIYGAHVPWMRSGALWDWVRLPITDADGGTEYLPFADMPTLQCRPRSGPRKEWDLCTADARLLSPPQQVASWGEDPSVSDQIRYAALLLSTVRMGPSGPELTFVEPTRPDEYLLDYKLRSGPFLGAWALQYGPDVSHHVSVAMPMATVNRQHALVQAVLGTRYVRPEPGSFEAFANDLVRSLGQQEAMLQLTSPESACERWQKRLGLRYLAVNWERYDEACRPPYEVWAADRDTQRIEAEFFERWAEADIDVARIR